MATPRLEHHTLPGALGDLLLDVRAADRQVPGPCVMVLHGFKGFKDWGFFPPLADRLARAGFTVVSYNASGSGVDAAGSFSRPALFARNTFSAELADAHTVLDALDRGELGLARPTSIGVVGHSRGGGIAILLTAAEPRVSALVTWAAVSHAHRWSEEMKRRWRAAGALEVRNQRTGEVLPLGTDILDDLDRHAERLDVPGAAGRIRVPWLVIHGAVDETVPVGEGQALAASAANPELLIVERTGHTFGAAHPFAGMTPALAEVFDATAGFLSRHLT